MCPVRTIERVTSEDRHSELALEGFLGTASPSREARERPRGRLAPEA